MCTSSGTFDANYNGGGTPAEGDIVIEKKGRGPAGPQTVTGICKDNSLRFKGHNGTKFDASDYSVQAKDSGVSAKYDKLVAGLKALVASL
jgi:hypothetical protein